MVRSTPSVNASSAPDHVVAVDAEVEGEVVAGSGRDDDERETVLGGHRGDEGLGAVTTGHAEDVGATGHGVLRPARGDPTRG